MKKTIFMLCLTFIGLSLFGQIEKKMEAPEYSTKEAPEEKPLMILKFNDEELDMGFENDPEALSSFDPELIESIEIYKSGSTTEKYGERGKSGVVVVTLKRDASNKALFKKLKSGKPLPTMIKTNVDVRIDNRTSFSLHPSLEVVDGVIKFKGQRPRWLTENSKGASIMVSLSGRRLMLDDLKQIRPLDELPMKNIEIIQSTKSTAEQNYDMILVTLKKSSAGRKFFRKLKRAQKE